MSIACKEVPSGYVVWHLWQGEWRKFLTMNHASAIDYATKWHGTVKTLHEPEDPPEMKAIDGKA